jgi:hypothetical protein
MIRSKAISKVSRHWLGLALITAVVLRLGVAVFLGDSVLGEQQRRVEDQVSYNLLARALINGKGYTFEQDWYPFTLANTPTAHWSFLYPLYLAGVYSLFGYHPLIARLIQVVICGSLSIWYLYRLGRRIFGETIGLVTAGLGAVYIYFIYYDATLMTEPFFILGILILTYLSLEMGGIGQGNLGESDPTGKGLINLEPIPLKKWVYLGVVLGLTALLRQTVILWVPFLLLWLVWIRKGKITWWGPAIALAILVCMILPWTIRNYLVYNTFLPLNSNAGFAFYSANHPDHGVLFDQDYVAPLPDDLIDKGLNEAQWNTALITRGAKFILEDPQRYLLLSLNRVTVFFNFWFSSESTLFSNLMRVFSYGLYLPFYLLGIYLSWRNWRRVSLLYLFAFVYSAMHILIWASTRYRLPIDAAMMPLAGLAVHSLWHRMRSRAGARLANRSLQTK